jgi:hypothetical protein
VCGAGLLTAGVHYSRQWRVSDSSNPDQDQGSTAPGSPITPAAAAAASPVKVKTTTTAAEETPDTAPAAAAAAGSSDKPKPRKRFCTGPVACCLALLALLVMGGVWVGIWQAVKHRPASAVAAAPTAAAAAPGVLRFSVDMKMPIAGSAGSSGDTCSSLLSKEPGTAQDAGGPVVSLLQFMLFLSNCHRDCVVVSTN